MLRVGESKVLIYRKKVIQREGQVGRERHEEIMMQDQRAQAAVTWAMAMEGRVQSGFFDYDRGTVPIWKFFPFGKCYKIIAVIYFYFCRLHNHDNALLLGLRQFPKA